MNKIEPAVQTLWFNVSTPADTTESKFIDLSQVASLVNVDFIDRGLIGRFQELKLIVRFLLKDLILRETL